MNTKAAGDTPTTREPAAIAPAVATSYAPTPAEKLAIARHQARVAARRKFPELKATTDGTGVAQIASDHKDETTALALQLDALGLGSHHEFTSILKGVCNFTSHRGAVSAGNMTEALSLVVGMEPHTTTEAMLAVQMAAELVQGTPLVGYSERRSENQFVFALSDEPADLTANLELLASRRWMDLAVMYSTGKRAIVTLRLNDLASIYAVSWHGPYVQLATSPTLEDAYLALPIVEQRLQGVIPDARLSIRRVNLGNKGVWFRLVLEISDFQQAVTVCRDLQASGVDCVPIGG